jgi:hypothetical protein
MKGLFSFFGDFCGPQVPYADADSQGWRDALAGNPCVPPSHDLLHPCYLRGYRRGEVEAKATRGEAIRFIYCETRCKSCGSHNYGMRMGCRCGGTIEWGVRIKRSQESEYLSAAEAETVLRGKLPVFDMMGDRLTVRKTKSGLSFKKRPTHSPS